MLFFHGVEPQITDPDAQNNHHALEDFAGIAMALKRHFKVAPLSELPHALRYPQRHRRTVFLSSDDGYANTLSVAAPVLKALELPWTLFVSTRHIDTGAYNPMTIARTFLRSAPDGIYNLPGLDQPILLNGNRRGIETSFLSRLRQMPAKSASPAIQGMQAVLTGSSGGSPDLFHPSERFLNWEQVRTLASSGVTIGAHADWHWAMHAAEHPDTLREQAERPRQRIEAEVGPCHHLAYPFGNTSDVGPSAWKAVRDAGYEYGFTTLSGTLNASQNPYLLPRYGLHRQEHRLPSLIPLLRTGNPRVRSWQRSLA